MSNRKLGSGALRDMQPSEIRWMCMALIEENKKLRILIDGKWNKLNWKKLAKEYLMPEWSAGRSCDRVSS